MSQHGFLLHEWCVLLAMVAAVFLLRSHCHGVMPPPPTFLTASLFLSRFSLSSLFPSLFTSFLSPFSVSPLLSPPLPSLPLSSGSFVPFCSSISSSVSQPLPPSLLPLFLPLPSPFPSSPPPFLPPPLFFLLFLPAQGLLAVINGSFLCWDNPIWLLSAKLYFGE